MKQLKVHSKLPISIAVCGSAAGKLDQTALKKAKEIGKLLAEKGVIVLTGATSGYTYEAAKAAMKEGGLTIGISPMVSREAQLTINKKPIDAWTSIIYTGHGIKGRNVVMVQSADAAIFIGGGTGTLNEFTIAFDEKRPIGILEGIPGCMELVDQIVEKTYKPAPPIVKSSDPKVLVREVLVLARRYFNQSVESMKK